MRISLFNRFSAFAILMVFIFTSCPMGPNSGTNPDKVVITPGEGNPRYLYLDNNGDFINTDTGRTVLFIENNKNAQGVFVVSDKYGTDSRVTVLNDNNNSTISVFFKKDSKFPYYMEITTDNTTFYAQLSNYREASSTYDIYFIHNGEVNLMDDLVLNPAVFDLYEKDNNLSDDQNLRLQKITVALGLLGSLSYYMDEAVIARGIFNKVIKTVFSPVQEVLNAVPLVSTVVAVVVAPVVSLVSPTTAAVMVLYNGAEIAVNTTVAVINTVEELVALLTDKPKPPPEMNKVKVTSYYDDKNKSHNKIESHSNNNVYHISKDSEIIFTFSIPYFDKTTMRKLVTFDWYEPDGENYHFFEHDDDEFKYGGVEEFQLRVKRKDKVGHTDSGLIAYGFQFHFDSDIYVNEEIQPVKFKCKYEEEATMHRDMVVMWFCIKPTCSEYVD